ncbi:Imidazole glycerol phosphate synthase amidotransferase subunit [Prochlorococcus sp. SS52]|nr:Imidazole glycerol phosphate synthase amidotransferase subunit [Prochlorococcus marinus str. LG]KGG35693.1 Imidazole glycerol phosphate synthase amidotransferase subunit [Prochlorococcus sp. SS52]
MGNLHSVEQSFKRLNQSLKIISGPNDLSNCDALILPGVGSFDPAMKNLQQTNLIPELKKWVLNNKPLLGICLGLQLLFESSDEGKSKGLGLLKGTIKHLPKSEKQLIPHMGWAELNQDKECPLFKSNSSPQWMYFVHSYSAIPSDKNDIASSVNFGDEKITAVVWKKKLAACQFHPEKSGRSGELLLSNWLAWLKKETKDLY